MTTVTTAPPSHPDLVATLCQACGACCACEPDWPRFSTEEEAELARIPATLIDPGLGHMAWRDGRCAALEGTVGTWTGCTIYADRPHVCRACVPGDDACEIARHRYGMAPVLPAAE